MCWISGIGSTAVFKAGPPMAGVWSSRQPCLTVPADVGSLGGWPVPWVCRHVRLWRGRSCSLWVWESLCSRSPALPWLGASLAPCISGWILYPLNRTGRPWEWACLWCQGHHGDNTEEQTMPSHPHPQPAVCLPSFPLWGEFAPSGGRLGGFHLSPPPHLPSPRPPPPLPPPPISPLPTPHPRYNTVTRAQAAVLGRCSESEGRPSGLAPTRFWNTQGTLVWVTGLVAVGQARNRPERSAHHPPPPPNVTQRKPAGGQQVQGVDSSAPVWPWWTRLENAAGFSLLRG